MSDKYALTWNDLSAAEKQTLIHIDRLGTMPEETPECYECVNHLITNLELVAYVPASQTLHPGKAFKLTPAGRALLPAGEAVDVTEAHNNVLFGKYQAYLEDMESLDLSDNAMNYQRWLEVEVIERDESNKMELTTLTASWESLNNRLTDELAAALARAQAAEEEAARLRGKIDTAAKLIKNECNASLIGWGGIHLNGLPHNLQGYARIFDAINQLTLNKKLK